MYIYLHIYIFFVYVYIYIEGIARFLFVAFCGWQQINMHFVDGQRWLVSYIVPMYDWNPCFWNPLQRLSSKVREFVWFILVPFIHYRCEAWKATNPSLGLFTLMFYFVPWEITIKPSYGRICFFVPSIKQANPSKVYLVRFLPSFCALLGCGSGSHQ